jgi:NADPH2:quinone reductase
MRAIALNAEGQFAIAEVEAPEAQRGEVLVRVEAFSLNPRDLRNVGGKPGLRPGIDFAGVVEQAPSARSPLQPGVRVAGLISQGSWGERIAVPAAAVAVVPDAVSTETAAALPSGGITALHILGRGGDLLGRNVLVTAANGAVGLMVCQLGRLMGARVVGVVRSAEAAARVKAAGAHEAVLTDNLAAAGAFGPYPLVLDSVGGDLLAGVVRLAAPGGRCVAFGATAGKPAPIDVADLYQQGKTLEGFGVFIDFANGRSGGEGLARLFQLVAAGQLQVEVGPVHPWTELDAAIAAHRSGEAAGKTVVRIV